MLKEDIIAFEDISIPFLWGTNCIDEIVHKISNIKADRYVLVTDDKIKDLYGDMLTELLKRNKPVLILSSPTGEKYKNISTLMNYINRSLDWGITRQTLIITLGGGIPGNIGGLLASLLFRGIRLIHIPTTLVAIFDSIISLKQAINGNNAKNLIGTFYIPYMILADIKLLQSLPEQQVRSGLCETIKNVLAIYPEEINRLKEVLPSALRLELEALEIISEISIKLKLRVMKNDKFEKKNALVLEYGHTTGHAIELIIAKNKLPNITHGEAVGIGMIVAAEISHALGHLSPTEVTLHYDLLQIIRSPTEIPNNIHVHDLIEHMKHDNKRGYVNSSKNEVGFILLEKLGSPLGKPECPITLIDEKTIENAIVKINNNFIPQKHYAGYKY